MDIIDRLLAVLAPYECLGCSVEGSLLCPPCAQCLPAVSESCYKCRIPSPRALTCASCRPNHNLDYVLIGTEYQGAAKKLIWNLKFSGARAAVKHMAERVCPLVAGVPGVWVTPVPTATSRARSRGYDQAKLLARELSRRTRLPYSDCLARHGHTRQVGVSRHQRMQQLARAFRVRRLVTGANILLVDDVLTTGATLESAAAALKKHGARSVGAVVFARSLPTGNRASDN